MLLIALPKKWPQVFLSLWKRLVEITVFPLLAAGPLPAPPGWPTPRGKGALRSFPWKVRNGGLAPGLESLTSPLGYAGHQPARFVRGSFWTLRENRLPAPPMAPARPAGLRATVGLCEWKCYPEGTGPATAAGLASEEGWRAQVRKLPHQHSKKDFHKYPPRNPPAAKSGELFHRLNRLHLHNHPQAEIQVSCNQSFQRFVIQYAINP